MDMTGWKTKVGAILVAVGGALAASSEAVPPGYVELSGWLKFAGILVGAVGTGFLGVGIGHKVEKLTPGYHVRRKQ